MLQGTPVVGQWEFETNWKNWEAMDEAWSRKLEQWWWHQTTENCCTLGDDWAKYVVHREPLMQERIYSDGRSGKTRKLRQIMVINGPGATGCNNV